MARGAGRRARRFSSTDTTTCSPPSRSICGTAPPFEPTIRDGKIYARGSVDDKGQLYLHVKALEAHLATRGTLPVNVIVLAEGEEEVGSEQPRRRSSRQHKDLLACDAVVISDSAMFAPGLPSILSSLRGLAYFQIDVQGPVRRSALGHVRRRRHESRDGARAHSRDDARRRRPRRDPGLLRQGPAIGASGAQGDASRSRSRTHTFGRRPARRRCSARRASRRSSACGCVRPAR